jgi:hypothetical protein
MNRTTLIDSTKELTAFIPLLGAYLILYGAVDLITYYGHFNIPIWNFITFSEIIFYFIKDIFVVLIAVSLVTSASVYLAHDAKTWRGKRETLPAGEYSEQSKKSMRKFAIQFGILAIVLGILLWYLTGAAAIWCLVLILVYPISLFVWRNVENSTQYFALILFVILLLAAFVNAKVKAIETAERKRVNETKFVLEGKLYAPDSVHYVIGKTEAYLFYYNSKSRETTVIKTDDVSRYIIKDY